MSSTKAIVLAVFITGLSAVIGVSTALYYGYRKAQEKLNVDGAAIRQVVTTVANLDETLHNIAGDDEGEFGKRAAAIAQQHPFTPPSDGILTEHQLQQFIAVKQKLAAVDQEERAVDYFTRVNRLRMAQIAGLEEQQMPLDEYSWVHLNVYLALVAQGMNTDEMQKTIDRSMNDVDHQLDGGSATPDERARLQDVRASIAEGREAMTDPAHALPKTSQSVPNENKELVLRHRDDLSRVFLAAIDLDTIDIMRCIETAKAK